MALLLLLACFGCTDTSNSISEETGAPADDQPTTTDGTETSTETTIEDDPPLPEIPEAFTNQVDAVLAAVSSRGYDTSEGEAPSPNLLTRAAIATTGDEAPLGDFFMVSVAWQVDKPFGDLGEFEPDRTYETDGGLLANFVTMVEDERSIWFICAESLVTFDLVRSVEDEHIEQFVFGVFDDACRS